MLGRRSQLPGAALPALLLLTQACAGPEQDPFEEVVFIAFGDSQYGGGADDKNTFQINAINNFPGIPWPEGLRFAGEPVPEPRGVLVAGDMTQSGQDGRVDPLDSDQLGRFEADYGLNGADGLLRFPVYEGYGNHEFDPLEPGEGPFNWQYHYDDAPGVDLVAHRNAGRVGLTAVSPNLHGHYSWDWGGVHFVNLDLFPGDAPSDVDDGSRSRDPRESLTFLEEDLAAEVGDSGRPIVLMSHYGFDPFSSQERWWGFAQQAAFLEVVTGYNVIAFLHGHAHATFIYEWNGIPCFCVGSPYYTDYNDDERGRFSVFRIGRKRLEAADVAWTPEAAGMDPEFSGDWIYSEPIERPDE